MALTRKELEDLLAEAIHQSCGASTREECGAWDMHVDDAINVMAELQGLGLIRINNTDAQAKAETP